MSRASRAALAVLGVVALGATGAASASAASHDTTLPGSVPSWANAAHRVGSTSSSTTVTFRVYLDYSDPAAAAAYAMAVSTPGSAHYGKFLTPAQFRARFSPSRSDVVAVQKWLRSQGFSLGAVPANQKYVEATGTLAQAGKAFRTSFAEFRVDGHTVRGNTAPLTIPSSLSGVEAVVGLDESQTLAHTDKTTPPPPVFKNAQPCSAYWGQKTAAGDTVTNTTTDKAGNRVDTQVTLPDSPSEYAPCGYAGEQLQGAYGLRDTISKGTDGSGVTVAVIDGYASPTIVQDLKQYSDLHGLPTKFSLKQYVAPGTYQKPEGPAQDPQGWSGEETLDLEAVHTMAPGANLVYVGAPNNYRDLDAIMNKVVDNHLADIVTNSYGYGGEALPTGYIKPQLDTQIQAAAEGISLFFSSGDYGDETGGDPNATPTPDWPASSPWVTAVGGTSMGVRQDDTRLFEVGWETVRQTLQSDGTWGGDTYFYGSGGGTSRLFAQPSYQKGVVPGDIAMKHGSTPMRAVPDVSALGDPTTGMLVGQTQTFPDGSAKYSEYRIGGTSLSSPLYAGMFALAVQQAGHEFGLANPALYGAAGAAYDITKADLGTYPGAVRVDYRNYVDDTNGLSYTARLFDADGSLTIHVRDGYDDVTGVGSPNGTSWLDAVVGYTGG